MNNQEEIKARLEAINKGCRFTHQSVMFLDMEKKGLANDIEWLIQQLREALERESTRRLDSAILESRNVELSDKNEKLRTELNEMTFQYESTDKVYRMNREAVSDMKEKLTIAVEALATICDIGETRDVQVAKQALSKIRGDGK